MTAERYDGPTIFDGVADPEALIVKSPSVGWKIEFSQEGVKVPTKFWALTKRGAQRKAGRWLARYERWKARCLAESVVVRPTSERHGG